MAYRRIAPPSNVASLTTTDDWLRWADEEHLFPPVAPLVGDSCQLCRGAVGYGSVSAYDRCQHCRNYGPTLSGVVPIAYSLQDGLESLLHQYKDFGIDYRWGRYPLGSILWEFMGRHLACIEQRFGEVDVATTVPSGNETRTFSPLGEVIEAVDDWPVDWALDLLAKAKPGRPGRGESDPSFYALGRGRSVRGRVVLLVDDTWTSGSSLVSAGARLREERARSVVGLTIGRQLAPGWGSADDLISTASARGLDLDRCVLCA